MLGNELEVEYLTSADTESKKLRQLSDYAQVSNFATPDKLIDFHLRITFKA